MQKDFTIQVLFCIDKASYSRYKISSAQTILKKSNSVNEFPGKL